jgi:two-component system NarL family sensor kinase
MVHRSCSADEVSRTVRDFASRDARPKLRHHGPVSTMAARTGPLSTRPRRRLGVRAASSGLLGVVTLGLIVAAAAMHLAQPPSAPTAGVTDWWLMPIAGAVGFGGTGTWLGLARPRLPVGWVLLALGLAHALAAFTLEYGVRALALPAGLPVGTTALWVGNWLWAATLLLLGTVLPLVLPDGRLPSRRWRPALLVCVTSVIVVAASWALTPYSSWSPSLQAAGARNPVGTEAVLRTAVTVPSSVLAVMAVVLGSAGLVSRWRHSADVERQQLKWILYGVTLTVVCFAAGFVLGPFLTAFAMLPLPACCLVAALRYGLWDIDVVVNKSLVYGTLTLIVVATYVACVELLGGLLGRNTGAPIVATALVAVAVEPMLRRVRTAVNRVLHGEPEDPFTMLANLGRRLETAHDASTVADSVLPDVLSSVARTLRLPYVAVELADGTNLRQGRRQSEVETIPLEFAGARVGTLVLQPGPGGLGRTERRLLDDLARAASVAAHGVLLSREVRRSREAAVSVREEERRRLHRELHDGLGPSLAALALQVETARDLLPSDAAHAARLLDTAVPHMKNTVSDVRDIVHGLRPPALDDLGLPGALRELTTRFAGPARKIDLAVTDLGPLPAAVEVAAYRITAEALTNATRHADTSRISVQVARSPTTLRVTVTDEGKGVDPQRRGTGVGIGSMAERAQELGGRLWLTAGPDGRGTQVSALLPTTPT